MTSKRTGNPFCVTTSAVNHHLLQYCDCRIDNLSWEFALLMARKSDARCPMPDAFAEQFDSA